MADRHTIFLKLVHDVPPYRPGFDACHHVGLVDPQDPIHAVHIDRSDSALFPRIAPERIGDIRAAAVWD